MAGKATRAGALSISLSYAQSAFPAVLATEVGPGPISEATSFVSCPASPAELNISTATESGETVVYERWMTYVEVTCLLFARDAYGNDVPSSADYLPSFAASVTDADGERLSAGVAVGDTIYAINNIPVPRAPAPAAHQSTCENNRAAP